MNLQIRFLLLLTALFLFGCQNAPTGSNSGAGVHTNHENVNNSSTTNHETADMKHDMSQKAPMRSAPDAAAHPYDLQFIDSMIHHHESAVVTSEATLKTTQQKELRPFLQKVIADQGKEITLLKTWRADWFPGKPSALNMDLPGMKMSSHEVPDRFSDVEYIDMMIPHHEGAVMMAKDALGKAEHPEIRKLANEIIRAQEAEIKKMRDWKTEWSK
jgi:uncharacterized protein (DUF305 family)